MAKSSTCQSPILYLEYLLLSIFYTLLMKVADGPRGFQVFLKVDRS